jgi:hypothetical protein
MKLIISGTPLQQVFAQHYPVDGNRTIEYEGEVRFPVNAVLARTMEKGEQVKVILIVTTGGTGDSERNVPIFKDELDGINEKIGAHISYETVEIPFEPTKDTFDGFLKDLIEKMPKDADIIADITYGMKQMPAEPCMYSLMS